MPEQFHQLIVGEQFRVLWLEAESSQQFQVGLYIARLFNREQRLIVGIPAKGRGRLVDWRHSASPELQQKAGGEQAERDDIGSGQPFWQFKRAYPGNPSQGLEPARAEVPICCLDLEFGLMHSALAPSQRGDLDFGATAESHAQTSLSQPNSMLLKTAASSLPEVGPRPS